MKSALVVGGSRGFGRGVVESLIADGAEVTAVARNIEPLAGLGVHAVAADASDPVSTRLLAAKPDVVVLIAGATPRLAPIHQQTWESFSMNWNADVKIAFHWLGAILNAPLASGSHVVVFSSGAALRGSPVSGGYAGSKATVRFIAEYAAEEARRAKLGIHIATVLPKLSPATDLGRPAVEAYAERAGRTVEQFLAQLGPPLTPALVGAAVLRLINDRSLDQNVAFSLDASGLTPLN
jgi:NAD(P)-dependent dehydrogenase (short-subunit alcohol dehydrogenase family)